MTKFSKNTRTTIVATKVRDGAYEHVLFKSQEGTVAYEEKMPGFHEPQWASWCAFRLLHPNRLHAFEAEIRKLFEEYKKGKHKWAVYNEEKRAAFQRYLNMPYLPNKKVLRK